MQKKKSAVLLGKAIGDSLGMQFETKRWNDPAILAWNGKTYGTSDFHKLEPGQWTDDTGMAVALTEALLDTGFNPEYVARKYVQWYEGPMFRGAGKTTKTALEHLSKSNAAVGCASGYKCWYNSGELGALGNGTAMRVAPIGVFYKDEPIKLIKAAKLDAIITHNSHEAQQASVAIAMAISLLLNGVKKEEILESVKRNLEPSRTLDNLNLLATNKLIYDTMKHKEYDRELDKNGGDRIMCQVILGTGYTSVQTVARALYCFVATRSFDEALELTIRGGGDTDTVAAIVGALCGAHYGLEGIEQSYIDQVEKKDYLLELDERLMGNCY